MVTAKCHTGGQLSHCGVWEPRYHNKHGYLAFGYLWLGPCICSRQKGHHIQVTNVIRVNNWYLLRKPSPEVSCCIVASMIPLMSCLAQPPTQIRVCYGSQTSFTQPGLENLWRQRPLNLALPCPSTQITDMGVPLSKPPSPYSPQPRYSWMAPICWTWSLHIHWIWAYNSSITKEGWHMLEGEILFDTVMI